MATRRNPLPIQLISAFAFFLAAAPVRSQALTPAWVELGEGSQALARIIVTSPQDCPLIQIDGASMPMSLRQPVPPGFRPVCELAIPNHAKSASVNGKSLTLPKRNPSRVIAIGDSGCRIKGRLAQDCNNPATWPFLQVAASASREKPDLIIHVGDYLYREGPCPEGDEAMCGGSPAGDNWDAWNADFFTPAAQLLASAPWAFTRGNHEDCNRTWRGFFYYLYPRSLDSHAWDVPDACNQTKAMKYPPPYLIRLGKFQLAIFDTSAMRENDLDPEQIAEFSSQLASLHPKNAWLSTHYPFWGFYPDESSGKPMPLVATLQAAWEKAAPTGYTLILGGHVHLFEYVSVDTGRPPQLVAGDGGTRLDVPMEASVKATQLRGARVIGDQTRQQFGYTVLTKKGKIWQMELKDQQQEALIRCTVPGSSETCQTVK
jgi:hypothetical protein